MTTYLDVYAAVRNSHGAGVAGEAKFASRNMQTRNGVAALVNSVIANIR